MTFLIASAQCFLIMPQQNSFHLEELNLLMLLTWSFSDCFITSFGESFKSVTQSYEMDIHYWDTQIQNVGVHFSGSEFLDHTTNNDLLNKIEDGTSMLNMKNLKLLMDCPNVNWKLFECCISKRESEEYSILINTGNFSLPILNNAFKTEANTIG